MGVNVYIYIYMSKKGLDPPQKKMVMSFWLPFQPRHKGHPQKHALLAAVDPSGKKGFTFCGIRRTSDPFSPEKAKTSPKTRSQVAIKFRIPLKSLYFREPKVRAERPFRRPKSAAPKPNNETRNAFGMADARRRDAPHLAAGLVWFLLVPFGGRRIHSKI